MRIYVIMLAHFMMNLEFLQLGKEFEETVNFCQKQKSDKIEQIGMLEDVFDEITDYDEKNALIGRLQKGAEYYEKMLDLLHKLKHESEDSLSEEINSKTLLQEEEEEEHVSEDDSSRKPMDMLRSEYKIAYDSYSHIENMKDLLEIFFEQYKESGYISLEKITQMLYDTSTDVEFKTAKNSIAAQLRRGAEEGRWQKIGRGSFASGNYKVEDFELNSPELSTQKSKEGSEEQLDNYRPTCESWDDIKF